jgi:uncharacterized RDD family membrane protein YckC
MAVPTENLFGRRALQRLIDLLIGLAASIVVSIPFGFDQTGSSRYGSSGVTLLIWALYEIYLVGSRGQTVGMMATGIKVVDAETGNNPTWGAATLRWLLLAIGFVLCFIPFLVIGLSPLFDSSGRQQGWHDKASRTRVQRA